MFINGQPVGQHTGGYSSFCFEITHALTDGENRITVFAEDDTRSGAIPTGKQSPEYYSYGCFYTRTTGIWQTVWLENTPAAYIKSVKMTPCIAECALKIEATFDGAEGLPFSAKATFHGKAVGEKTLRVDWNHLGAAAAPAGAAAVGAANAKSLRYHIHPWRRHRCKATLVCGRSLSAITRPI